MGELMMCRWCLLWVVLLLLFLGGWGWCLLWGLWYWGCWFKKRGSGVELISCVLRKEMEMEWVVYKCCNIILVIVVSFFFLL